MNSATDLVDWWLPQNKVHVLEKDMSSYEHLNMSRLRGTRRGYVGFSFLTTLCHSQHYPPSQLNWASVLSCLQTLPLLPRLRSAVWAQWNPAGWPILPAPRGTAANTQYRKQLTPLSTGNSCQHSVKETAANTQYRKQLTPLSTGNSCQHSVKETLPT